MVLTWTCNESTHGPMSRESNVSYNLQEESPEVRDWILSKCASLDESPRQLLSGIIRSVVGISPRETSLDAVELPESLRRKPTVLINHQKRNGT